MDVKREEVVTWLNHRLQAKNSFSEADVNMIYDYLVYKNVKTSPAELVRAMHMDPRFIDFVDIMINELVGLHNITVNTEIKVYNGQPLSMVKSYS